MPAESPLLHVVLHEPEIPQNAGNIGRTCVAVGAKLWLVRPLGFSLEERYIRRSGLDYWQFLDFEVVEDWADLLSRFPVRPRIWCVECPAQQTIWQATFSPGDMLVFGTESSGLPARVLESAGSQTIGLPMRSMVRSLNLASTANTVVYEAIRQFGGLPS